MFCVAIERNEGEFKICSEPLSRTRAENAAGGPFGRAQGLLFRQSLIERRVMVQKGDASLGKGSIAPELLAILCCPETKQEVCLLEPAAVERLNQRIVQGEVKTKDGRPVSEKIDGGLLRKDQTVVYPIRDQIPIMLIEEGIPVEESDMRTN
jgi:uncharacterized protein YbaR (Trm112 family)